MLVALDLSPADEKLLTGARTCVQAFGVEKVYFLHAIPDFSMPHQLETAFQTLFHPETPIDERVSQVIASAVQPVFDSLPDVQLDIDVVEGKPLDKLLQWIEIKSIDLLVIGSKEKSSGSGVVARKVAAQAACDALFLPENTDLQTLVVLTDFSAPSARAIQLARQWAQSRPDLQLILLHVTEEKTADVESGSFNSFLAAAAENAFQQFAAEQGFSDLAPCFRQISRLPGGVEDTVLDFAATQPGPWILTGARGHSPLEKFIFGSTTEKLVQNPLPCPVWVVR